MRFGPKKLYYTGGRNMLTWTGFLCGSGQAFCWAMFPLARNVFYTMRFGWLDGECLSVYPRACDAE